MNPMIYEPDTLDFDFSGILGTIGSGIASAAKYVGTNLLTQKNIQNVVGGIVSAQVAKFSQSKTPSGGGGTTIIQQPPMPSYGGMPVQSQPVIISGGGGGGMPLVQAAPAQGGMFGGINPIYLMGGAVVLAVLLSRR